MLTNSLHILQGTNLHFFEKKKEKNVYIKIDNDDSKEIREFEKLANPKILKK